MLEEVEPDWREFRYVMRGAMIMQILSGTAWLKLTAALALAGAMAAAGVSFVVPTRYESSAVLRLTRQQGAQPSPDNLPEMKEDVLSHGSLLQLIQKPSLDLYKSERQSLPLEDIVEQMRDDIQVQPLPMAPGSSGSGSGSAFRVSFAYPDQVKARAVVRELVTRFAEQNVTISRNGEAVYQAFWHRPPPPAELGENLEVLDPASLPKRPSSPDRLAFTAWGLVFGLLLGLLVTLARWQPKVLQLAASAVAGCALAASLSLLIPDRYTSTATMRIVPPQFSPQVWYSAMPAYPLPERVWRLAGPILSRSGLSEIIQKPALDLYLQERTRQPLEEVVENMRRDIDIRMVRAPFAESATPSAFTISFSYSDRYKAQAVVREVVTRLIEDNITQQRNAARTASAEANKMAEHQVGERLEVLDPASLPEAPVSPNRLALASALGLAVGLALGACLLWPLWRKFTGVMRGAMRTLSGTAWLKLTAALAVAGAIAGAEVSFAVPERYESSAVLLITTRPGARDSSDNLAQMETDILSQGSLSEIIQKPSLNLYPSERARLPMDDIVQQMRRDLQLQWLPLLPGSISSGPAPAFRISFSYPDQYRAQAVVRELVTTFTEENVTIIRNRECLYEAIWHQPLPPAESGADLEVLDPANLPTGPTGPNRLAFMACGLGAGMLLGVLATLVRRRPKRALQLAAWAVAGCALAADLSFLIPDRYTSTVTMRFTPPVSTQRWQAAGKAEPPPEHVRRMEQQVLSRDNLARIIQKPRLDLYPRERARQPQKEVVENMRRDIDIHLVRAPLAESATPAAFSISFSYTDRYKAQAVVRALVLDFTELYARELRTAAPTASPEFVKMAEHKAGENLEVLDPASLPEAPVSPNRLPLAALGLALGLALGTCLLWFRQQRVLNPAV